MGPAADSGHVESLAHQAAAAADRGETAGMTEAGAPSNARILRAEKFVEQLWGPGRPAELYRVLTAAYVWTQDHPEVFKSGEQFHHPSIRNSEQPGWFVSREGDSVTLEVSPRGGKGAPRTCSFPVNEMISDRAAVESQMFHALVPDAEGICSLLAERLVP